jgi:hypothetical protein
MLPKLQAFYFKALLPELASPRDGKCPGIREPGLWVIFQSVHINIYVITWIVPLCYYNGHIRNPLTSVLILIKTWNKRYLFVNDELINTYRLLSLDYHLFGMNI